MRILRLTSTIFMVLAILTSCTGGLSDKSQKNPSGLYPVRQAGKWGYINSSGKMIINPQFDGASRFSDGLALVRIGEYYGYINTDGKYVINPQYHDAHVFSEGLAYINDSRSYIDTTGKLVFKLPESGEAIAISITREPSEDVLDGELNVFSAMLFSEGLVPVKVTEPIVSAVVHDKYGYVDKTGKMVIPLQFRFAGRFSEGLAEVVDDNGKDGFINKEGNYVINPQFDRAGDFHDGLARIIVGGDEPGSNGKIGFIDKTGKFAINPQFDERFVASVEFSEKLSAVSVNGQLGYIDTSGAIVIKPQFQDGKKFAEGLAAVKVGNKWGYIDKSGNVVINPQFDEAREFTDGVALVKISKNIGYIDKKGTYIWNPTK